MKIPKLKKGDAVIITWSDTHTQRDSAWLSNSDYDEWCEQGTTVTSIGFFMSQDKKYLRIIGDIDEENICRPINIGIGLITEIKILAR
jgi:hypothetical protein